MTPNPKIILAHKAAEQAANLYVNEQSHRLASFIVRIHPL